MAVNQCYTMDGQVPSGTNYFPCHPEAEVSACCQLNGTSTENDICTDTGLCYSTAGEFAGFFYANGCTDSSGHATECPQICAGQPSQYNFNVLQCAPGQFCCRGGWDNSNCCNDTSKLVNSTHLGALLDRDGKPYNRTFDVNAFNASATSQSTANGSSSGTSAATVGGAVGGVLGALLLASLVALGLLWRRDSINRREVKILEDQFTQMMHTRSQQEKSHSQVVPPYPGQSPYPLEHQGSFHRSSSNHGPEPYRSDLSNPPPVRSELSSPQARPAEMQANRGISELSN